MAKNGTQPAQAAKLQKPGNGDLPLFFKRPMPLDAVRHAEAGLGTQENMAFAADTNSVFINITEFAEAAKYYPIVYTGGESPMPTIVTGLEKKNYFIGTDNLWKKDTYIPAYVRRYPFVFMSVPNEDTLLLCIDEAAEQFSKTPGENILPLYANDKPSELAINALNFCSAFQQQHQMTLEFCAALQEAGLLSPTRSDAKLQNGREIKLSGFQIIDEGKFNQLTDDKILEFHKKNWLALIYFSLLSASNWRHLISLAAQIESA